jgi:hypothetical protein
VLVDINLIWLAISLAYPSGKSGIFYLLKLFLPAFVALGGGGGQHSVKETPFAAFCLLSKINFTIMEMR